MKDKDLFKIQKEFASTPFGKRAKIFSIAPLIMGMLILVGYALSIGDDNIIVSTLYLMGCVICIVGACITQMQYGILLKDYIDSKKK